MRGDGALPPESGHEAAPPVGGAARAAWSPAHWPPFAGEKMAANNGWFQQSSKVPSFAQMLKKNLPVPPPGHAVTAPAAPSSQSDGLSRMASKVTPVTGTAAFPPAVMPRFLKTGPAGEGPEPGQPCLWPGCLQGPCPRPGVFRGPCGPVLPRGGEAVTPSGTGLGRSWSVFHRSLRIALSTQQGQTPFTHVTVFSVKDSTEWSVGTGNEVLVPDLPFTPLWALVSQWLREPVKAGTGLQCSDSWVSLEGMTVTEPFFAEQP